MRRCFKCLGEIRTITGNRNTVIDPYREATSDGSSHTHDNFATLNKVSEDNNDRIMFAGKYDPVPLEESNW